MSRLYEYSLRYYVAGLTYAQSPYAFHTIGSTMAVNAEHYASVRGFPRREAGEDFYLLNKLAKVGSVHTLEENNAMRSDRDYGQAVRPGSFWHRRRGRKDGGVQKPG